MSEEIIPDLWPEEITNINERAPLTVLKEQAAALGRRTKNVVTATIESSFINWGTGDGELLTHRFYVEAPALEYRRPILDVGHSIDAMYPVWIDSNFLSWAAERADNEHEMISRLARVFGEQRVIRLVQALLSQSG